MPKKITISYYWDEQWRLLFADEKMTIPVRTKFFSDEQTKELHAQTNNGNQGETDERSVATKYNRRK